MTELTSAKKKIKEIRQEYSNDNTVNSKIVKIVNELKPREKTNKKVAAALKVYRKEMFDIKIKSDQEQKKQQCSEKEKKAYASLEDLRGVWRYLEPGVDKLMTGFYLFYPALRSDWANVDVEGDFFVFDKFIKRSTGGEQGELQKPIVDELKPLIRYLPAMPRNNDSFRKRLNRIFQNSFGKNIGINMLRKIWVCENRNLSISEREELARDMNHSLFVSRLSYEKVDMK